MASILRVRTTWTGLGGAPYLSTHYFTRVDGTSASAAADAVAALWEGAADVIVNTADWNIEGDVAVINDATGALTGIDSIGGGNSGSGASDSQVLSLATQGLLRLTTGDVVGGRILKGHTFIPGPTEASNEGGAPDSAYMTVINNAMADMLASPDAELLVWSRKNGTSSPVVGGSAWSKWAVLRSRRD